MSFCNTSQGLISLENLLKLTILPHEHLFHNLTRFAVANPEKMSLENFFLWRSNPFSFSTNVLLNDVEESAAELKRQYNLEGLCVVYTENHIFFIYPIISFRWSVLQERMEIWRK